MTNKTQISFITQKGGSKRVLTVQESRMVPALRTGVCLKLLSLGSVKAFEFLAGGV